VVSFAVTRKLLMLEVVKAAQVLRDLGLRQGDRIALNLPNILEQLYYTEAAKRLGILYTPVFGGFSDKTLSDRIHNAGAHVVITSDGAYRNAQVIPFKETYTDPALDTDPGWLPLNEIAGAAAVLVDMRWPEGARAVLREARRHGVPAVADADIAPPAVLRELISLADHVLFSEPALLSLASSRSPEKALLEVAAEVGAAVLGVTLGEHGALIWRRDADAVRHFPSIPVRAVDTLNAGDIWHGTYVYGLVNGWDLSRRVRMANVAAAMKCEHFGGRRGAPRLPELLERSRELIAAEAGDSA
jgi:sugar/nucleoside kinase (ribokinase family)